uniref:IQ calmodulin-binding motif-containing protein 1 n=1 Tax=Plectus sambesii TaxID=2011161 RepID=A0A914XN68_9BILA
MSAVAKNIADKLKSAKYNAVPTILLETKDLVDRQDVMRKYGLSSRLRSCLKHDYLKVDGTWKTATEIARLALSSCSMSKPPDSIGAAEVATGYVELLANIRREWLYEEANDRKTYLENCFGAVCALATTLFATFKPAFISFISHPLLPDLFKLPPKKNFSALDRYFLRLIADSSKMTPVAWSSLSRSHLFEIFETLVRRLDHSETNNVIAEYCVSIILFAVEATPLELTAIRNQFSSLGTVLKIWEKKGFDRKLSTLKQYLEDNSPESIHLLKLQKAAAKIQAAWRGHKTRNRLKKMKNGVILFQRLYRIRQDDQRQQLTKTLQAQEDKITKALADIQLSRRYMQKRFNTIASLHRSKVDKFLALEADAYATKIQAAYRGYRMRVWYKRRWRIRNRLLEWPGLTVQQRELLQGEIDRKLEAHKRITSVDSLPSLERQRALHDQVQALLGENLQQRRQQLSDYQQRELTLTHIKRDVDLLEGAPQLADIQAQDLFLFRTASRPAAMIALLYHQKMLAQVNRPWWKTDTDEIDKLLPLPKSQ